MGPSTHVGPQASAVEGMWVQPHLGVGTQAHQCQQEASQGQERGGREEQGDQDRGAALGGAVCMRDLGLGGKERGGGMQRLRRGLQQGEAGAASWWAGGAGRAGRAGGRAKGWGVHHACTQAWSSAGVRLTRPCMRAAGLALGPQHSHAPGRYRSKVC